MKPPEQMMKDANKLAKVRSFIDEKQSYRFRMPDGTVVEFSGAELIRTGEAFAELLEAGNSGDNERMLAALQRVAAIDCDS
jgi:hypothetical protein